MLKNKIFIFCSIIFILIPLIQGCSTHEYPPSKSTSPASQKPYKVAGKWYKPINSAKNFKQTGIASWYGKKFHGKRTANGEIYNMFAMTGAHKTLPLGTYVNVKNLNNNKEVVVKINDRGPFVKGRILDLSYKAAKKLGYASAGKTKVTITALGTRSDPLETSVYTPTNYYNGMFTVQVGSFKDIKNAKRLKDKLDKLYTNAHIAKYYDGYKNYYRVRLGRYSSLDQAIAYEQKLIKKGFSSAFVIAE